MAKVGGFLIKPKYTNNIKEIKGFSDRSALLKMEINGKILHCLQIYAPTSTADKDEIEKFYDEIDQIRKKNNKEKYNLIIMDDWNGQIG